MTDALLAQVAEETRTRIMQAIRDLGYQPNLLARGLVNQRSQTVGVVASGLDYYGPSRTLIGIDQEANALGYALLLLYLRCPGRVLEAGSQRGALAAVRRKPHHPRGRDVELDEDEAKELERKLPDAPHRRRLALIAEGCSNAVIAERLYISPRTVDYHLRNVFATLGVRSRVELVRLVGQEEKTGAQL